MLFESAIDVNRGGISLRLSRIFFDKKEGTSMRPRTLKSAAEQGDLDAVKYHLAKGENVNATTAAGHFALGGAIINRHAHVVDYLIANGADVDQQSEYGWSPLYLAAWSDCPECAALLLLAGAKINTKTIDGWHSPNGYTPLHIAAERGHLAIVMLLVRAGAQINARTGDSKTALELALEFEHASVAAFLKSMGGSIAGRRKSKGGKHSVAKVGPS